MHPVSRKIQDSIDRQGQFRYRVADVILTERIKPGVWYRAGLFAMPGVRPSDMLGALRELEATGVVEISSTGAFRPLV